jgi:hypothetical protein
MSAKSHSLPLFGAPRTQQDKGPGASGGDCYPTLTSQAEFRAAEPGRAGSTPFRTARQSEKNSAKLTYLVLNFINMVTYFVPAGRESDSAVLGWGTHHAEAEPL